MGRPSLRERDGKGREVGLAYSGLSLKLAVKINHSSRSMEMKVFSDLTPTPKPGM